MHRLCIVVHDIDKAVEYDSRLGVGPWRDFANPAALIELTMPNGLQLHDDAGTTLMVRSSPPGGTTSSADRSKGSSPS